MVAIPPQSPKRNMGQLRRFRKQAKSKAYAHKSRTAIIKSPLALLPRAIPAVKQEEERGAKDAGQPVIRPRNDDHGPGGDAHEAEVEDAPRHGSATKRVHHAPVHKVDAWHVDLQKVPVGCHSVIHQEA